MTHACHANGCEGREAHIEIPFCKKHFKLLPEPHQKRLWAERAKGGCGACWMDVPGTRSLDWNSLYNLAVAIIAAAEAPEYEPRPEWVDEQGFCWMGGIHDAQRTMKMARAIIKKFSISAGPAY